MFTLKRFTQNPSYLFSKDITPVVMGQVNYVYLDEIHAECLVSLLKRHFPGCHGKVMFPVMRSTQNPSYLSSKDITRLSQDR
jgi:hypothetical protein